MDRRTKKIRNAIWRELEDWSLSAMAINSGRCQEFGWAVKERLEPDIEVEVVGAEIGGYDRIESKYAGHVWIHDPVGQRHYDAEDAEGVERWKNLDWFSHVS
jgi:hypothetical protein